MARDLDSRLRALEEERDPAFARWGRRLIAFVLLCGLGAGLYYWNRQDQKKIAENGPPLPDMLIYKPSAARRDLALLNRDLLELAKEADKSLSKHPGPKNQKKADRYLARLHDLHQVGVSLEAKLTREERRVLMATQHAEKQLETFVRFSCNEATFDQHRVDVAERQIERAQALSRGATGDAIVSDADHPNAGGVVGEIKSIATGLNQIKNLRGAEQIPADTYVPEIDAHQEKPHKKHRKKHHEE